MRNATIQTHRECADKIREILLDMTVEHFTDLFLAGIIGRIG